MRCLRRLLSRLLGRRPNKPSLFWALSVNNVTITTKEFTMRIDTEHRVLATIRPVTAAGNPARIDGPVTFAASNPDIVRFEQVDDLSAYIYGVQFGETEITATFDADLDADEVRHLTYTANITVVEAEAVGATFDLGEPTLVLTPPGDDEIVEPDPENDEEQGDTDPEENP